MKAEEIKGCHNCNFHCMNHNSCDVGSICKQGEKWQAIPDPLAVFQPKPAVEQTEPIQTAEKFLEGKIGKLQNTEIDINDYTLVEWLNEFADQKQRQEPLQGESAEEILNSHPYLKTWTENPDDSAIEVCNIEQALWAMEEFASQRSELTDEEIEAQFPFDEDIDFVSNIDAQMGARWARDQIRDRQKGGKP